MQSGCEEKVLSVRVLQSLHRLNPHMLAEYRCHTTTLKMLQARRPCKRLLYCGNKNKNAWEQPASARQPALARHASVQLREVGFTCRCTHPVHSDRGMLQGVC